MNNNGKDIMLEDFVISDEAIGKGIFIIIGNPKNPKLYFTNATEEDFKERRIDMIDTLIEHLTKLKNAKA